MVARSFNFKDQETREYKRPDLPEDLGLSNEGHIGPALSSSHPRRGGEVHVLLHRIDQALENGEEVGSKLDGHHGRSSGLRLRPAPTSPLLATWTIRTALVRKIMAGPAHQVRVEMQTEPKTIYLPR